ncbi:hypothetical protein GGX14DRAFT_383315, partial [Mycena pura]
LVLYIPCAELEGSQRVLLSHATTFDDSLDRIYETIGCADVVKKPVLTYKLSNTTKSAEAVSLTCDDDWKGCLDEVSDAEGDKKKLISVKIIVTDQYIASLRAKLKINLSGTTKGKGKKGAKMQILDLEHAGSGDDDFDDGLGIMEKEKKCMAQLEAKYSRCQVCGPDKVCKIDISGIHCKLGNAQIRAWSAALALETRNVTLSTPPNDTLFARFFKNSRSGDSASAPIAPPAFPFPPYMGVNPYGMMPWTMPGMHPFGNPATPVMPMPHADAPLASGSKSKLPAVFPSSDPPDMGAINPYPEINEFIHQLDGYQPKRHLLDYITKFDELDFFNIDEIAKLGTAAELSRVTGISLGNSTYIMEQVKAGMKRVDRAKREMQ